MAGYFTAPHVHGLDVNFNNAKKLAGNLHKLGTAFHAEQAQCWIEPRVTGTPAPGLVIRAPEVQTQGQQNNQ